jgi:hypothetical protein
MEAQKAYKGVLVVLAVAMVLLVATLVVFETTRPTPVAVKNAQTQSLIQECYYGIETLEAQHKLPLRRILADTQVQDGDLNQRVTRELCEARVVSSSWDRIDTNSMHIIDYWGTPLLFYWPEDLSGKGASAKLTNYGAIISVWSAGANGTNEYGNGDDVVLDKIPRLASGSGLAE